MPKSNYPGGFPQGITIRGLPLTMTHPGEVFWVNSTTVLAKQGIAGSNTNKGTYAQPFATIDYAVGRCLANRGDVIMVMPGHSEDIASATSLVLDVAGVAVIGLGSGTDRPDLNFSATAGSVEIDADNVVLHNLTLTADVSAVVVGVNVDGASATISHCEFNYNATGDDFLIMLDVDTVNGTMIDHCVLRAENIAGAQDGIRLDTSPETIISNNYIYGDFTGSAIQSDAGASLDLLIDSNRIYNADTTAGFVINLDVADTGLLVNNRCGTLFATAPETALDPGSLLCLENYVCNAVDESGAIVPTLLST